MRATHSDINHTLRGTPGEMHHYIEDCFEDSAVIMGFVYLRTSVLQIDVCTTSLALLGKDSGQSPMRP